MIAPLWIITAGALALLHAAGAPHVTPTWEPGANTVVVSSVAAATAATRDVPRPGEPFGSTTPFGAGPGYKAMLADIERWAYTPRWQQQHPVRAIRAICRIAHAAHEQCIAAPALDLFGGRPG